MAYDAVVNRARLEGALSATADEIRSKTGRSGLIGFDADTGFAEAVAGLRMEELIGHAGIPEYVKQEALRVAQRVNEVRQPDSIVFIAMSDSHYYGEQRASDTYPDQNGIQSDEGVLHGAMAAKILAYGLNIDFIAHLGDLTWGSSRTTPALLRSQSEALLALLSECHAGIPYFQAIGNHDTGIYYHDAQSSGEHTETGGYLFERYTALSGSENTVFGGIDNGGYCYRDFPEKKLRVFLLNTSEALVKDRQDNTALGSQRKWFADALLQLNEKSDAPGWSFIVLSHYPADYGGTMPLSELIRAYVEGTDIEIKLEDGSVTGVNFAGANAAKMIAQFHGHVHNFIASKLYTYESGKGVQYDAWRVCVPNGQYARENYYSTVGAYTDINFAQSETYEKTPGTAEDTSFVVNVVNPAEMKIHSICYGAGCDREIDYASAVYCSITAHLTNAVLTGDAKVEKGHAYNAVLRAADGYELKSVSVAMGGADITGDVYSDGNINIPAVTGDVTITAAAEAAADYTNRIPASTDTDGSVFGYKSGYRLSSSGAISAQNGSYVTGFIPAKYGDRVYLKNVHFEKTASGSLTTGNQRICFYDETKTLIGLVNAMGTEMQERVYEGNHLISFRITKTAEYTFSDTAYFRLNCAYIGDDSVITVNEPIG